MKITDGMGDLTIWGKLIFYPLYGIMALVLFGALAQCVSDIHKASHESEASHGHT